MPAHPLVACCYGDTSCSIPEVTMTAAEVLYKLRGTSQSHLDTHTHTNTLSHREHVFNARPPWNNQYTSSKSAYTSMLHVLLCVGVLVSLCVCFQLHSLLCKVSFVLLVRLFISLSLSLSLSPPISLFISPSLYLSLHIPFFFSLYPSLSPSVSPLYFPPFFSSSLSH